MQEDTISWLFNANIQQLFKRLFSKTSHERVIQLIKFFFTFRLSTESFFCFVVYAQHYVTTANLYWMRVNSLCLQLLLPFVIITGAHAQQIKADSAAALQVKKDTSFLKLFRGTKKYECSIASVVVPAAMLGYGIATFEYGPLRSLDHSTKAEIMEDNGTFHTKIDNYTRYAPALSVYALNAMGIHGAHNFRDRTIILGISSLIMMGTVGGVKTLSHRQRPDGSTFNSFPSGHTATSFMGAEFMRQEYKDVSPWYGVYGYAVAATTGVLRMYNNRHWLSDVVAGAGLGILSAKAAYWVFPKMERAFAKKDGKSNNMHPIAMPTYSPDTKSVGISLVFFPGN